MKSPTDPKITAIVQLHQKARLTAHRARAIEELILSGEEGLEFAAEMLHESVSALDFWFQQFEKARKDA